MAPGALAFSYLGYAGGEAAAGSETAIRNGLIALGLLAVVMFLPRLIKKIRHGKTHGKTQGKTHQTKASLKERDARSEINRDEYEQMKRLIKN